MKGFALIELLVIVEKCEKCGATHDSVHANFLLYGFKICQSCKLSETLFPVLITLPTHLRAKTARLFSSKKNLKTA